MRSRDITTKRFKRFSNKFDSISKIYRLRGRFKSLILATCSIIAYHLRISFLTNGTPGSTSKISFNFKLNFITYVRYLRLSSVATVLIFSGSYAVFRSVIISMILSMSPTRELCVKRTTRTNNNRVFVTVFI